MWISVNCCLVRTSAIAIGWYILPHTYWEQLSYSKNGKSLSISSFAPLLLPQKLAIAENFWITHAQSKLANQKTFSELKRQLSLFSEEGLWRCGGWFQNAEVPYAAKHPILLPRNHLFTVLTRSTYMPMPRWDWMIAYALLLDPQYMQFSSSKSCCWCL